MDQGRATPAQGRGPHFSDCQVLPGTMNVTPALCKVNAEDRFIPFFIPGLETEARSREGLLKIPGCLVTEAGLEPRALTLVRCPACYPPTQLLLRLIAPDPEGFSERSLLWSPSSEPPPKRKVVEAKGALVFGLPALSEPSASDSPSLGLVIHISEMRKLARASYGFCEDGMKSRIKRT